MAFAAGGLHLAPADRVRRTVDGHLRYAGRVQAAYRTIVCGGVGFDAEVHAVRDQVREGRLTALIGSPSRFPTRSWQGWADADG